MTLLLPGNFDDRVLDQINAHEASSAAEFAGAAPKFIDCPHGIFRVMEIPDRARVARRQWLSQILRWDQHYIHSHKSIDFLSQLTGAFEILLVSGNDIRRALAIVKQTREALPRKATIPILSHCTTADCVALLNRGADDVLHCEMPTEEAVMRRLQWRSRRAAEHSGSLAVLESRLRSLAVGRLAPLEHALLTVLAETPESIISYSRIVSRIRRSGVQTMGGKSLSVVACNLRKKLARDVRIVSEYGRGYALIAEKPMASTAAANAQYRVRRLYDQ